jgi:transposase InsO family protein
VDTCEPCQELRPRNPRETLKPQGDGNGPWDKIASDIFEAKGRQYLATVDYYSNFIEVDHLQTITTTKLISVYKKQFARFGIPTVLTTDSGSQFTSGEFQNLLKDWGIIHVRSSPGHHSANGKAEAAVKVAKHLIMKVCKDGTDPNIALLEQRNCWNSAIPPVKILARAQLR